MCGVWRMSRMILSTFFEYGDESISTAAFRRIVEVNIGRQIARASQKCLRNPVSRLELTDYRNIKWGNSDVMMLRWPSSQCLKYLESIRKVSFRCDERRSADKKIFIAASPWAGHSNYDNVASQVLQLKWILLWYYAWQIFKFFLTTSTEWT